MAKPQVTFGINILMVLDTVYGSRCVLWHWQILKAPVVAVGGTVCWFNIKV